MRILAALACFLLALPAWAATSNVLFILTQFTNKSGNFTQAEAQAEIAYTAQFIAASSYGRQTIASTVTPWLTAQIPVPPDCDIGAVSIAADAAAVKAGYVLANYERKYYVMAPSGACGWEGMTDQAGPPFRVWNNGKNERRVYAHELGHSFGLMHAGRVARPGGAQAIDEYGDWYSTMGATYMSDYNAPQKAKLGWILPGEIQTFNATAGTAGTTATYTINALERAGGALYAVKIRTPNFQRTYWIEYRTNYGVDEYIATVSGIAPGVQVRLSSPFESAAFLDDSLVFDTGAGDRQALPVGATYTDDYGVAVRVLEADGVSARVQVSSIGLSIIPTVTSLTSTPNPSAVGQAVVFVPTVTPAGITGNVRIAIDGVDFCNQMIWSGNPTPGQCVWADGSAGSHLAAGSHSVVAFYTGDSTHRASQSATITQVVGAVAPVVPPVVVPVTPPVVVAPVVPPVVVPLIVNGSFELPVVNGYAYGPAGATWTGGGIQANGSAFGAPNTTDGRQTAFIQGGSVMSQTVTLAAGNYTLAFKAARRQCCVAPNIQPLKVTVDGVQIGSIVTPPASGFGAFSIPFTATAGAHVIAFTGQATTDMTAFVDAVTLDAGGTVPVPICEMVCRSP